MRLLEDETINVCAVNSLGSWCTPDTVLTSRCTARNKTKSTHAAYILCTHAAYILIVWGQMSKIGKNTDVK